VIPQKSARPREADWLDECRPSSFAALRMTNLLAVILSAAKDPYVRGTKPPPKRHHHIPTLESLPRVGDLPRVGKAGRATARDCPYMSQAGNEQGYSGDPCGRQAHSQTLGEWGIIRCTCLLQKETHAIIALEGI
jgi:hypothetical protein